MIRERRNKDKLRQYYQHFITTGNLDPNIHPWVAESWKRSQELGVPNTKPRLSRLSEKDLAERRLQHQSVLDFLDGLYRTTGEYLNKHNISMILADKDFYVLKNYSLPFMQRSLSELEGHCLTEEIIGTSSISISYRHRVPFLLFGPEGWLADYQGEDACSAPILHQNEVQYILTMAYAEHPDLPHSAPPAVLFTIKYALEEHLRQLDKMNILYTIMDSLPFSVYQVARDGQVSYANTSGQARLKDIIPSGAVSAPNLSELFLNYYHTPIEKGFLGIPAINKEVTWITPQKTYEDITSIIPIERNQKIDSVVAVTLPIEDLRSLVAHAAGYRARYTLSGMVGQTPFFTAMKDKAARVARHDYPVLLQGEPGTGKQRLAHGIHQAGSRAAGPFITVRCGDMPPDLLEEDLMGSANPAHTQAGKLELANGGTLFLDEVEELPIHLADRIALALASRTLLRASDNTSRPLTLRVIAACDSDLKRLTDKGAFSASLFDILSRTTLRVPNLRDRKEDIPFIASHILAELAEQHQIPSKKLTPEALQLLLDHEWPGNIKELQSVIEQAFFKTSDGEIQPHHIHISRNQHIGIGWKRDRALFLDAWKAAGGNISRLASQLGVSRVTLYRYLKKYDLESHDKKH